MGKIADFVRKLLDIPKGERDRRVSAVPAAVLKPEEGPFHWVLVKHFAKPPATAIWTSATEPFERPATAAVTRANGGTPPPGSRLEVAA